MRRVLLACALVLAGWSVSFGQEIRSPRAPSLGEVDPFKSVIVGVADPLGFTLVGGMLQTVQSPTTVEFTASPDHNATDNGTAVLTRYDVEIYTQANQTAVVRTINIGKPTPAQTTNLISYTQLRPELDQLPVNTYVAKVVAVGPGGTGRSAASNPFQEVARPPTAGGTPVVKE